MKYVVVSSNLVCSSVYRNELSLSFFQQCIRRDSTHPFQLFFFAVWRQSRLSEKLTVRNYETSQILALTCNIFVTYKKRSKYALNFVVQLLEPLNYSFGLELAPSRVGLSSFPFVMSHATVQWCS